MQHNQNNLIAHALTLKNFTSEIEEIKRKIID